MKKTMDSKGFIEYWVNTNISDTDNYFNVVQVECNVADSDSWGDLKDEESIGHDIDILTIMESYAKYIIESLTDEEIDDFQGKTKTEFIDLLTGEIKDPTVDDLRYDYAQFNKAEGAKWARNELLKRLNQRP